VLATEPAREVAAPTPTDGARVNADALPRRWGVGTATGVVIASMVGAGIFTTSGLMLARVATPAAVLLCWSVAGLVALCGALSYAELAAMMPHAGGEYVYLREIYGPAFGFLTGWVSFFVGFSAPIAASALTAAAYFASAGVIPRAATKLCSVLIVVLLTLVHARGGALGSRTQNVLTVLKLALIGGLLLLGFIGGGGDWQHLTRGGGVSGAPLGGFGLALLFASFAYSGWNGSAYIAGEVERPERNLPRSLALGTLAVTLLYLLLNLLLFYAAPAGDLRGVVEVFSVALQNLFGHAAGRGLAVLIGLALLSSLSAYVLSGPRVYYAMARDGLFFPFAARVHPRFRTPALAILAQGACAIVMAMTGTFEQLLTYIAFALGIFPWLAVMGVVVLRVREPQRERPYRTWGFPLTPLLFLAISGWMLVVAFMGRPGPSLAALATLAAGVPVYWITQRASATRRTRSTHEEHEAL
jgi:APA family basic amino acid/polyamine antiporter